ncbi:amidohydrolase family protein [Streptomyces malaysiensis]|uniref:amidohydrolase family protein n=1 Tax=Streptomyces malaysiensis TaxID=92644 RepID=UPI002B2E661C|nr:amidohydrolase family protein [Streptomyces malaysiensis]
MADDHTEPRIGNILIAADGRIQAIDHQGPLPDDVEIIDATGCLVLPGFIDAHRHCWMPALRGVNADHSLQEYVRSTRNGVMPHYRPEDVYIGNLVGLWEALDAGVTTVVDFAHCLNSPDHVAAAMQANSEAPVRTLFAVGLNDVPGHEGGFTSLQQRIDTFIELLEREGRPEHVTLWMSLSDTTQAGTAQLLREVRAVRAIGVPMTLHANLKKLRTPISEVNVLASEDLLGPDMLWAHMTQATPAELKAVHDAGGQVVSVPEDEMQMGMGTPALLRWEAAGGAPSLGISVVSAASGDLFGAMRLALQTSRMLENETVMAQTGAWPSSIRITSRDVVTWATRNGAIATGQRARIGTLEPGKQADIVILKPGLFASPLNNPWSSIAVHSGRHNVDTVLVGGQVVKRGGVLLTDLAHLTHELGLSHQHVFRQVASHGGSMRDVQLPT